MSATSLASAVNRSGPDAGPDPGIGLADHQLGQLGQLAAALSPSQLQWASGYLAGLAAAGVAAPLDEPTVPRSASEPGESRHLTVLYGSQTGNGRAIATALASAAEQKGLSVRLVSMADYRNADLIRETLMAIVVSTHGEGEPPDDAEVFWEYLDGRRAPDLSDLSFALLALGDSSYENYCQTGRDFDARLQSLGASPVMDRIDCDLDYDQAAADWRAQVLTQAIETLSDDPATAPVLQAVPAVSRYSREQPFDAEVLENQRITGRDSIKHVYHLELSLEGSGLSYEPGDALGVWPLNESGLVTRVLEAVGLDGDAEVTVDGESMTLTDALGQRRELTQLSRPVVEAVARLASEQPILELLENDRRGDLVAWMEQHQVVDLLDRVRPELDAQELVDLLRPLTPRLYSIASSAHANPGEVHLTVDRVGYQAFGFRHGGAASGFLSSLSPGQSAPVYIEPNPRFRLPEDPSAPLIMIGPGTGVAPFRAFLEQRDSLDGVGPSWLFFGNPSFDSDFLYQLEWLRRLKNGSLDRLDVAFSRDQSEKIYVQQRMRENGAELFRWIEKGAHVYVCGDAQRMAPDVDAALHDIIASEAGLDAAAAAAYVKSLKRQGRYLRDVY